MRLIRSLHALCAALAIVTPAALAAGPSTLTQSAFPSSAPAAQPSRIPPHADLASRIRLTGHVPAWATSAADRGPVSQEKKIKLILSLSRTPQLQAAFDQLLLDQQNPSSPRFHHWLTPTQIGEQFGPTQPDIEAVVQWIATQGLQVTSITPSRTQIQLSGSAALVSAAFQTSLHTFARGNSLLQAPTSEPTLPTGLAPVVAYISGLAQARPHIDLSHTGPVSLEYAGLQPRIAFVHPDYTLSSGDHYILPADFSVLYDLPSPSSAGTPPSVMILGGSRLDASDISTWETLAGLPDYQPNYIVPGNGNGDFDDPGVTNDDNQAEATLDFERVYGTAPAANVDLVLASGWLDPGTNQALILYAINSVNDPILSMSFGDCESDQTPGYLQNEASIFAQAAAQGISSFAAAGDAGAAGCEIQGSTPPSHQVAAVSYPCSFPSVTCVGGTQFSDQASPSTFWSSSNNPDNNASALSYIPEGVWNEPGDPSGYTISAGGGGVSAIFPKPTWQAAPGVPADGLRDVPDISFSASLHNAYATCLGYDRANCVRTVDGFGGTSASAPSMAGIAALLNQHLGTRQGNLNPLLYQIANSFPAVFHDATPATSGVTGCSTSTASTCNNSDPSPYSLSGGLPGFALTIGYDRATGLGSLDVKGFLAAAVTALNFSAASITLAAQPATITTAQTATFSAMVSSSASGTPTGTIQFFLDGASITQPITVTNGSATSPAIPFTTAGTYAIVASYSGDSTFAPSSATISFVVTQASRPATATTLTGSAAAITTLQTAGFTASVSVPAGTATIPSETGPTGTIQFIRTVNGVGVDLGSPVPLLNGTATLAPARFAAGVYIVSALYTGDSSFSASTSAPVTLSVSAVPTTTTLPTILQSVTSTQALSFTASISPANSGGSNAISPTGNIQFLVDGQNHGAPIPLSGLTATLSGLFFTAGSHTVSAVYSGDNLFAPSDSFAAPIASNLTPTSTAFTSAPPSTLTSDTTAILSIAVSGLSPSVSTSAQVIFYDGSTLLATSTHASTGTTLLANLVAGPFAVGTHSISAAFLGDRTYAASTTSVATLTVTAPTSAPISGPVPGPGTVSLSPAIPSLLVIAGSSASDTVRIFSNGFTGTQNLSCTVNYLGSVTAPNPPTCAIAPNTVTLISGAAAIPIALTVASVPEPLSPLISQRSIVPRLGSLTLAPLLLLTLPRRSRRLLATLRPLLPLAASILLLVFTLTALTGCGQAISKAIASPTSDLNAGTTKGSYTVSLTSTNPSRTVTSSTTISLLVQ